MKRFRIEFIYDGFSIRIDELRGEIVYDFQDSRYIIEMGRFKRILNLLKVIRGYPVTYEEYEVILFRLCPYIEVEYN